MKKTMKKVALLLVALFVFAAMFAGCNNTTEAEQPEKTQEANESNKPIEATQEKETQETALEEYEVIFTYAGNEEEGTAAVQDAISAITKEKINATIKFMPIGWSAWAEQTTLIIAGNEKVDLMFTSNYYNYSSVVARGDLLPLDDLLNDYGQDIKSVLAQDLINSSKIGGEIYGIPSIRDFAADFGIAMRKDLVEKNNIDLDSLKTYEDLTALFQTIKDNEPGVMPLVKGGDTTTFVEQTLQSKYDRLDNFFGVIAMDATDYKVVNLYETQDYADSVALVRSWFESDFISKDSATSTEQGVDVIKAGEAFSTLVPMKPGYDLQVSTQCGMPMVTVRLTKPVTNTSNIINVMTSIAKTTGDAQRAMMMLNLMYSDAEIVNLYDNGIEGINYVVVEDNVIDFPEGLDATTTTYSSNNWMVGNNYMSYVWKGDDPELWSKMEVFNDSSVRSPALGFVFNAENVKTEVAAVTNVQSQYRLGIETGTLDPETALPEYIAKLKDAGIDVIIAEKQAQLEAWAKENK